MKNVIVIGTGGHAKVISDIIELKGRNGCHSTKWR